MNKELKKERTNEEITFMLKMVRLKLIEEQANKEIEDLLKVRKEQRNPKQVNFKL